MLETLIKRNVTIYEQSLKGATKEQLALQYNLTPQRIRQICQKMKIDFKHERVKFIYH